jgi:isopentenyl-diphosphate delta-isomerase
MNNNKQEEILDLVDENDCVIGQMKRSFVHAQGVTNYRYVGAMIVNNAGQLWLPRRTLDKEVLPGHFGTSMGGHVSSGESYLDALRRELKEELFLDLDSVNYRQLGLLTPKEHNVPAFTMVYEIKLEKVNRYNKNDFSEAFWITPKAFWALVKKGEKTGSIVRKVIELFYNY